MALALHEDTPLLSLEGVSKRYLTRTGPIVAVQDVSIDIREGEFVSLVGPSGSGKSTLLKLVAGLLEPSCGEIRLRGEKVAGPYPQVGIVFQQPLLLRWRTVLRNVLLPAEVLGLPLGTATANARRLLQVVGLTGFEGKMPYELSGGMQQRVALCRALIHNPTVLLMDEPFGALDELTREEMGEYLHTLWRVTGKTVLFVTHSVTEAVYLSTRVVVLSSRPGTIQDVVDVRLDQPRAPSMRFSTEFGELVRRIRRGLGLAT